MLFLHVYWLFLCNNLICLTMFKSKALFILILICYCSFIVLEINGNYELALNFNLLIAPLISVLYFLNVKDKSVFFSLFLICYSLPGIIIILIDNIAFIDLQQHTINRCGNGLYILSYLFLIVEIGKLICFKYAIKKLKFYILILVALNNYFLYVLQNIINPNLNGVVDYYLELSYNIVVITLLSIALINYFCRNNKKALFLFFGSLCIVFSEVIDIAYIYVEQGINLNIISTTLIVIAFYFFYKQSSLPDAKKEEETYGFIED